MKIALGRIRPEATVPRPGSPLARSDLGGPHAWHKHAQAVVTVPSAAEGGGGGSRR
jgi:hypothetical protein